MTRPYRLKQISPKEVEFNIQNPRAEDEDEIRSDKTFEQLKDSVAQFGVLVPVVVHENKISSKKKFRLIDGERRVRAALATNIENIPAHIAASEDRIGELVQAFHIHMLRKQWKPVSTARAFKLIQKELKKEKSQINKKELLEELQVRTGCTDNQLQDLSRAINYSENILKDVDRGKIKWSHLIQFEASFVEQLEQHFPGFLKNIGKHQVRNVLVLKAKNKIIKDTRDLIENILPIVKRAKNDLEKRFAQKLFKKFIDDLNLSPQEVKLSYDKKFPPPKDQLELAKEIQKECELLSPLINQIEPNLIISFSKKAKELRSILESLKETISSKLRQLKRVMS